MGTFRIQKKLDKICFVCFLLLLISCGNEIKSKWHQKNNSEHNNNLALLQLKYDYRNQTSSLESALKKNDSLTLISSCFPLHQQQSRVYKVLYPRDTIVLQKINCRAKQEVNEVSYTYALSEKSQRNDLMDFPFFGGNFSYDSLLNLRITFNNNYPCNLVIPAGIKAGQRITGQNCEAVFLESDSIGTVYYKAPSFSPKNEFEKHIHHLENTIATEAVMEAVEATAVDAQNFSDTDLKLKLICNFSEKESGVFIVWFCKNIGIVKMKNLSSGITLELLEY